MYCLLCFGSRDRYSTHEALAYGFRRPPLIIPQTRTPELTDSPRRRGEKVNFLRHIIKTPLNASSFKLHEENNIRATDRTVQRRVAAATKADGSATPRAHQVLHSFNNSRHRFQARILPFTYKLSSGGLSGVIHVHSPML